MRLSRVRLSFAAVTAAILIVSAAAPVSLGARPASPPRILIVLSSSGREIGQAKLPSTAQGIDFTWTKPGCAGTYEDPAIVALPTENGNLVTRALPAGSGPSRLTPSVPFLIPCISSKGAARNARPKGPDLEIIINLSTGKITICATWNGKSVGCIGDASSSTAREMHLWLFGGSAVKGAWPVVGGKPSGSGLAMASGADEIDIYPKGEPIPFIATGPGPMGAQSTAVLGRYVNPRSIARQQFFFNESRSFPVSDGFDLSWTERACGRSDDLAPVVLLPVVQSPSVPPGTDVRQKLASSPLLVPCVSRAVTGSAAGRPRPAGVTVYFNPFRAVLSFMESQTRVNIGSNKVANMAAIISYAGHGKIRQKQKQWTPSNFKSTALVVPGTSGFQNRTAIKTKNTNITDIYTF